MEVNNNLPNTDNFNITPSQFNSDIPSSTAFSSFPTGIDTQSNNLPINNSFNTSFSSGAISTFMERLRPILDDFLEKIRPLINALMASFRGGNESPSDTVNILPIDTPMHTMASSFAKPSGGAAKNIPANNVRSSSSSSSGDPGTTEGRAKYLMDRLQKELGLTKEQAAGIVGNLMTESNLDPGATNAGDGADGSASIGIGQWNMDRARGVRSGDFVGQVDHLIAELKGPENKTLLALGSANSPAQAATIFSDMYERPSSGHASLGNRIQNANWALGL